MPTWSKVLLGIAGGLILAVLLGIVGVRYRWRANQERMNELGERMRAEGKALGARSDADGCIGAALGRNDAAKGFWEHALQRLFLKECLAAAPPSPAFCESVPKTRDAFQAARWSTAECTRRGHGDQSCAGVMQAVQDVCWPEK